MGADPRYDHLLERTKEKIPSMGDRLKHFISMFFACFLAMIATVGVVVMWLNANPPLSHELRYYGMDWVGAGLILLGTYLNAQHSLWTWPVYMLATCVLAWVSYIAATAGLLSLQVVLFGLYVYAWRTWYCDDQKIKGQVQSREQKRKKYGRVCLYEEGLETIKAGRIL